MVCTVRIVFSFVLPVWHSAGHGMGYGAVLSALHSVWRQILHCIQCMHGVVCTAFLCCVFCTVWCILWFWCWGYGLGDVALGCMVFGMNSVLYIERQVLLWCRIVCAVWCVSIVLYVLYMLCGMYCVIECVSYCVHCTVPYLFYFLYYILSCIFCCIVYCFV